MRSAITIRAVDLCTKLLRHGLQSAENVAIRLDERERSSSVMGLDFCAPDAIKLLPISMKSELFSIADAGGNIYPGTFRTSPECSWFKHVVPDTDLCPSDILQSKIAEAKSNGDHAVKCLIETQETVTIKSEPA